MNQDCWIGLINFENRFQWIDRFALNYTNWHSGELYLTASPPIHTDGVKFENTHYVLLCLKE